MAGVIQGLKNDKNKGRSVVQSYSDPLIELLHSSDLNKDKGLSDTLVEYIDDIQDNELKQWCIDSLTILRDLEKIETQLDQWEFHTLDFTIEVNNQHEKNNDNNDNNSEMQGKLAKRVLEKSNSVRELLSNVKPEIKRSVARARKLSRSNPAKVITDAGTILIELTMRLVKLAKQLDEKVTIGYSRAKLTIIGAELKKLVTLDPFLIDKEIIKNYKIFVNNLLNQLNNAVSNKDTVGLWETVAIVGDVEKMFDSMKRKAISKDIEGNNSIKPKRSGILRSSTNISEVKSPSLYNDDPPTNHINHKSNILHSINSTETDKTLVNEDDEQTSLQQELPIKTLTKVSAKEIFNNDNELIRTKISDHMPQLLNAFQQEKHVKPEINVKSNIEKIPSKKENDMVDDKKEVINTGIGVSFFNPSILSAFYQPKLNEPIYIHKSGLLAKEEEHGEIQGSTQKQITSGNEVNEGQLLTNASIAVRLDHISQENEAQSMLLEREREIKDNEIKLNKLVTTPRPLTSSSPILQNVSSSILSKSLFFNNSHNNNNNNNYNTSGLKDRK